MLRALLIVGFYALVPWVADGPWPKRPTITRGRYPGVAEGGQLARFQRSQGFIWTANQISESGVITLGQDPNEVLGSGVRGALPDRLAGLSFAAGTTLAQAMRLIATQPPRDGDGRAAWKPLVPSKDGRLRLRLGPTEILNERVASRGPNSKDIQDTFNRANGNLNGSTSSDGLFTWSLVSGVSAQTQINSNQLRLTRSGADNFAVALASLSLDTLDHYAQAELVSLTFGADFVSADLGVRSDGLTEGYGLSVAQDGGGTGSRQVYDVSDGSPIFSDTVLTTSGTAKIEVDGSAITVTIGGAEIAALSGTDTQWDSLTGVTVGGLVATSDSNIAVVDNFRAADLAAPYVPPALLLLPPQQLY